MRPVRVEALARPPVTAVCRKGTKAQIIPTGRERRRDGVEPARQPDFLYGFHFDGLARTIPPAEQLAQALAIRGKRSTPFSLSGLHPVRLTPLASFGPSGSFPSDPIMGVDWLVAAGVVAA